MNTAQHPQKHINRDSIATAKVFDDRSLDTDYPTLIPLLKTGWQVLDVGCGTGAISKGIAEKIGMSGYVTGIDHTAYFIEWGKAILADTHNLRLIHADLYSYQPDVQFDLIVTARVFQWLSDPLSALIKMKAWLKPGGVLSILDYNHNDLLWQPEVPGSMLKFYKAFLQWRSDSGMSNRMPEELPALLSQAGFINIEVFPSDEVYERQQSNFKRRAGIWTQVAQLSQLTEEGYLTDSERRQAIEDYDEWLATDAESMTMKLMEVRASNS